MGRIPVTGYLLAGGKSRRMGQNKALLAWKDETLLARAARTLELAADQVIVLGSPELYGGFGYDVVADKVPGLGPMGGLYSALHHSKTDWILLLACDMPLIDEPVLGGILDAAIAHPDVDAIVPETARGLEPLCAAYHVRTLPKVEAAVAEAQANAGKAQKLKDFVASLELVRWPAETSRFANANTPDEFAALELAHAGKGADRL